MGNEYSISEDCELFEPYKTPNSNFWTLYPAVQKKDGSRVSVFIRQKLDEEEEEHHRANFAENAAKQLRTLRHPSILKFLASCENVDETYLITEPVKPLEVILDDLSGLETCAGLYNVLEALCFLHERGGTSHNNVCLSSVYATNDGSWKLAGMDFACKFKHATPTFLGKSRSFRDPQCIPPEENAGKVETSAEYGHARDAYAFGVLCSVLMDQQSELSDMSTTFRNTIERELLNSDLRLRPKLRKLKSDNLFKNEFLEIINFLSQITLKTTEEKEQFFRTLVPKLLQLPAELVAMRLTHRFLVRFVVLDMAARDHLFAHLLTPCYGTEQQSYTSGRINPLLPTELYKKYVIPYLIKIFHVRETHVRLLLLKHFSSYARLFPKPVLSDIILPQMLVGLKDVNEEIVASSLRGLADLVPLLGAEAVIGGNQGQYFFEGQPKDLSVRLSSRMSDIAKHKQGIITTNFHNSNSVNQVNGELAQAGMARKSDLALKREEAKRRREERLKQKHNMTKEAQVVRTLPEAEQNGACSENSSDVSSPDRLQPWNYEQPWNDDSDLSAAETGTEVSKASIDVVDAINKTEISHAHKLTLLELANMHSSGGSSSACKTKPEHKVKSKGALKLGDKSTPSALPSAKSTQQSVHSKPRKPSSPKKLLGDSKKISVKKPKNDQLGAEYDVLSVEIKTKPQRKDIDFFSAIAEELNVDSGELALGVGKSLSLEEAPRSNLFAAADDSQATGGWEDDMKWEDF